MNEFDLIRDYFDRQADQQCGDNGILCGIGDDAAVLELPLSPQSFVHPQARTDNPTPQKLVTCTDTLIAGRHFPGTTSPFSIGYKAVAVNLSDIAAMGAMPHSILLALSIPQILKEDANWLQEFASGLFACCDAYGVQLIGGDTTKSETLTVTVTALGYATRCAYRHGAKEGDVIAVTGSIGDAAFALADVLAGQENVLQHRLDQPTPRVTVGQELCEFATSMIDISDGLLQDLGHICQQSGVGAALQLDALPTHGALKGLPFDERMQLQLAGGDDYELLFTIPKERVAEVSMLATTEVPITVIGEVIAGNEIALYHQGQPYHFQQTGYQHF